MQPMPKTKTSQDQRPRIRCSHCGHVIFDGTAIRSRVVTVGEGNSLAKCRCKHWVSVPVVFSGAV